MGPILNISAHNGSRFYGNPEVAHPEAWPTTPKRFGMWLVLGFGHRSLMLRDATPNRLHGNGVQQGIF
jgi:hypothetical protein